MKPLTVGSTFTGIGGADLGFEWAGFDIKWQCEFDSWKQQVLRAHWPDVELFDDICTMQDPAPVDVMIGGFPCQDLSVAGRRKGFSGERSVLAFEFLRVAESLQPRWIVLENVPGLLSSNGGRDFARLIDEVVGCGYGVAWRILDARYFGVPQRRRRVFIVARRTDAQHDSRGASRLALRALFESGSGDTSSGWQAWTETTRSTRASSEECGSVGTHGRVDEGPTGTLTRMYSEQSGQDFGGGRSDRDRIYNATAAYGAWREESEAGTLSQRDYKSTNHIVITDGGQPGCSAFRKSRRAASMTDDETWVDGDHANTLNRFDVGDTRTTHAIVGDTTVRRLTPLECERLMGLPDGWTAPEGVKAPDSKRYAACGDAIVTTVAFWIADRIRMIEEEEAS
jgi:DNA (cytosine-5)-methyltransferase 1